MIGGVFCDRNGWFVYVWCVFVFVVVLWIVVFVVYVDDGMIVIFGCGEMVEIVFVYVNVVSGG